jgi:Transposase IS116/IS110/IS902 family
MLLTTIFATPQVRWRCATHTQSLPRHRLSILPLQDASRHVPWHYCTTRGEILHAATHPCSICRLCGPQLGRCHTRYLRASGAQRERCTSAEARQKYAGMAPVTERSGKQAWVHWRLQCPQYLRHTLVEGAADSPRQSCWAQVDYPQQRDQGTAHHTAVRALACTWSRLLLRGWAGAHPV